MNRHRQDTVRDEPEVFDAIVIGAGPSGIFCAINAAPERRVLVLEKMPRPGIKFLLSGSGRCNITHAGAPDDFIPRYGGHGRFLRHALYTFPGGGLLRYFRDRGMDFVEEEGGKIFPASGGAAALLKSLLDDLTEKGAALKTGEAVREISAGGRGFVVRTDRCRYTAASAVIATGGMSYPGTGSSGDGYALAGSAGLSIVGPKPALVPLYVRDYPFGGLAGISVSDSVIAVHRGGKKIASARGDLLFTHRSLSGPGILDISRYVETDDELRIALAGGKVADDFHAVFGELLGDDPSRTVKRALSPMRVPDRLMKLLFSIAGIETGLRCGNLPGEKKKALAEMLSSFRCAVLRTGGFGEAMVTAGGVDLRGIDSRTMESKAVPGLFVIGEALDVDGDTGGYNLQACFSTAFLAARRIREMPA